MEEGHPRVRTSLIRTRSSNDGTGLTLTGAQHVGNEVEEKKEPKFRLFIHFMNLRAQMLRSCLCLETTHTTLDVS